jgi:hypothetical protein
MIEALSLHNQVLSERAHAGVVIDRENIGKIPGYGFSYAFK